MNHDIGVFTRRRIISPAESYFAAPPVVGGSAATLDPAQKTAQITLSGGNLVATLSGSPASHNNVRGTTSRTTGKFYFEVTLTSVTTGTFWGVGLCGSTFTATEAQFHGGNTNSIAAYGSSELYYNGSNQGGWSGTNGVTGNTIQTAVDLTTRKHWVRRIGDTNWNDTGGWSPDTASGGFDISTFDSSVYPTIDFEADAGGSVLTVNFGATAYVGTPPAGYGNW